VLDTSVLRPIERRFSPLARKIAHHFHHSPTLQLVSPIFGLSFESKPTLPYLPKLNDRRVASSAFVNGRTLLSPLNSNTGSMLRKTHDRFDRFHLHAALCSIAYTLTFFFVEYHVWNFVCNGEFASRRWARERPSDHVHVHEYLIERHQKGGISGQLFRQYGR
jgi:hypothetical protein